MNLQFEYGFSEVENKPVFKEVEKELLTLQSLDLKVEVKAISLNPVDYKVGSGVKSSEDKPKLLGWDVSGVVTEVGSEVSNFAVGDEVYYAGDITRPGANAKNHIVDSRIVGKKPKNLTFEEAAAMPLTTLAAYEALFDGLKIGLNNSSGKSILIIGGAGGVGSIAIQLVKKLTNLKVITTSSREETTAWSKKMGADEVINYKLGLKEELARLGVNEVDYIFCTNNTDSYFDQFYDIIKPFGGISSIVELTGAVKLGSLMKKCVSFSWEFMFARTMFSTSDLSRQGEILNKVSSLLDEKKIVTTMNINLGQMTAESLTEGHDILKSGRAVGKIVLKVN